MQQRLTTSTQLARSTKHLLALLLVSFLWLQFAGVVHKLSHTATHLEQLLPEHSQQNKSDCQLLDLHCGGLALSQALPVLPLPTAILQITQVPYFVFSVQTNYAYQACAPPQTSI